MLSHHVETRLLRFVRHWNFVSQVASLASPARQHIDFSRFTFAMPAMRGGENVFGPF